MSQKSISFPCTCHLYHIVCLVSDACSHGDTSLKCGSTEREGTVEICIDGVLGTICHSSWDSLDATVICRQLGFPSLGNGIIIVLRFNCGI